VGEESLGATGVPEAEVAKAPALGGGLGAVGLADG